MFLLMVLEEEEVLEAHQEHELLDHPSPLVILEMMPLTATEIEVDQA